MADILIIPGYGATSESNWFPWLAREVEKQGRSALVFNPPSPTIPRLDDWLNDLKIDIDQLIDEPIIIGHSLGCVAAMHAVQKYELTAKKLILVAPPYSSMGIGVLENFFKNQINFHQVSELSGQVIIIGSEDDWIVPLDHVQEYGKQLKTKPLVYPANGHFMSLSFPEIMPLLFN